MVVSLCALERGERPGAKSKVLRDKSHESRSGFCTAKDGFQTKRRHWLIKAIREILQTLWEERVCGNPVTGGHTRALRSTPTFSSSSLRRRLCHLWSWLTKLTFELDLRFSIYYQPQRWRLGPSGADQSSSSTTYACDQGQRASTDGGSLSLPSNETESSHWARPWTLYNFRRSFNFCMIMDHPLADKLVRMEFCSDPPFDEALCYRPIRRVYIWKHPL